MKKKKQKSKVLSLAVILAVIGAMVPITVFLKTIPVVGVYKEIFLNTANVYDFFSFYKSILMLVLSLLLLIVFLYKLSMKELKIEKSVIYIPVIVAFIFFLLSTLFSAQKNVGILGLPDRYEGFLILVTYFIVFFIAMNIVKEEKELKYIVYGVIISSAIIGIIGIFQYMELDIFKVEAVKQVICNNALAQNGKKLDFSFDSGIVYSTLYNPNYVGSFTALVIPLILLMAIRYKKINGKLFFGVLTFILVVDLIASRSRGGLFGLIVAVLILIFIMHKEILKHYKIFIACTVSVGVLFMLMNAISGNSLLDRLTNLRTQGLAANQGLSDISVADNEIRVTLNEKVLRIVLDQNNLAFKDNENKMIAIQPDNGDLLLKDSRFDSISFKTGMSNNISILQMIFAGQKINFGIVDGSFKLISSEGEVLATKSYSSVKGIGDYGSGRGYIWMRTLPLLKNTIFIGHGPDTYPFYFPQDDYIGKFLYLGDTTIIVDKPHNYYLQTAVNTGMASLIALLILFGIYFYQGIRIYFRCELKNSFWVLGLGIFAGVSGYLVSMLFNDSNISVAPVFWILLGVGCGINLKLKKELKIKGD